MSSRSPLEEILLQKQDKVRELQSRGIDPYPLRSQKTHSAEQVLKSSAGTVVCTAGRLVQMRVMGKASFAHLQDSTGKLQIYLKQDLIGEQSYQFFKKDLHLGDFIQAEGKVFVTKTGEITIEVSSLVLLAKALRPLPEKWHGLKDTELRYRQRHLDLISSEEVRRIFETRSKIIDSVRTVFSRLGFLEVETPVLIPQAGGAAARPFVTYHQALDADLYMRIATELYLKRLIIGGFEKVYEIGRIFRNEGIDTRHNPEFTMLEAYQAYADYQDMVRLLETLFEELSSALKLEDFKPPFEKAFLPELWQKHCGEDIHNILDGIRFKREELLRLASSLQVSFDGKTSSAKLFERIFDVRILPHLNKPVFVMDYPAAITPLAKNKPGDHCLVERFEFFIQGQEMANAYTELNDPFEQRERLKEQVRQRQEEKEAETDILDEDFVQALEHGMPPTGGIGIGIDRLVMALTGQTSIREVILFPTLKPEAPDAESEEEDGGESAAG